MVQSPTKTSRPNNDIITAYLAAYNVVQFLGWTALLVTVLSDLYHEGPHGVYEHSSALLKFVQTAAILEVIHAATGLVRSNWVLTGFQIFSRVFIVWGVLHSVTDAQDSLGHILLVLAWSITEVIRYPFYVCQLIGEVPYILKWARYTFFIVLYPIGVSGELLAVYSSLASIKQSGLYSISMPNKLNMVFSYYYYLIFFSLMYIPIFPQLYGHMFTLRKKVISNPSVKAD